ncbi:MAG: hypothetical protein ACE5EG_09815 [Thermoanaerobaculia bacterium]
MRVRFLAAFAILALASLFLLKAAGKVWPAVLDSLPLARASAAVLLAASLLMLLFFSVLRAGLRERGRRTLAAAATIGMAGAGIGVLVDLRSLLVTVDLASATREALTAGALGEVASVAALLWFFVRLHRRARRGVRGTGFAIAGSTLLIALAMTLFALQVSGLGLDWLRWGSYLPALALAVVAALAMAGLVRFFVLLALDPSPLTGPA